MERYVKEERDGKNGRWNVWDKTNKCPFLDVMPVDDIVEHDPGPGCFCGPRRDDSPGTPIYIHNSMDGREDFE